MKTTPSLSTLIAIAAMNSQYYPDQTLAPEPWAASNNTYKGSGHRGGGLNVEKSRAAAKAARKARKKKRKGVV
jgi:hypothetical protein